MTVMTDASQRTIADGDACWEVCLSKDSSMDGVFVVAVKTTGIYCRPSCPARKPKRENVLFFLDCDEAEANGFRPCLRCHPRLVIPDERPEALRRACEFLEDEEGGTLAEVSARAGISTFQLQRLFKRTLGMTPGRYREARRVERLKEGLRNGRSVTRAMYDAGYSSSSRLYESAGEHLGMTPATYGRGGRGVTVRYHISGSPLGYLLVAGTERGVCAVRLGESAADLRAALEAEFPQAHIEPDAGTIGGWVSQIAEQLEGARPRLDLPVDVQGTAFQRRVWQALREIAYGSTRTYAEIAEAIGQPRAARAVGQACASNPVPLVIPCHRVIRSDGDPGGYGLGVERKRRLLEMEKARAGPETKAG